MGVWETKSGELAASSSHDFERRVLHLLRAFWPALVRPRETQRLDRYGVDLLVWSDDLSFPCVVQCKELYQDEKFLASQWHRIAGSIDSFANSPYTCTDYVFVHNRTGEEQDVRQRIESKLAELRAGGKATRTTLWDRQSLIRNTKSQLRHLIAQHLSAESAWLLDQQNRFFTFGDLLVPTVPVTSRKWIFKSGGRIRLEDEDQVFDTDVSALISSPKRTRWTLVIGHFGTGKTTAALRAATCSTNKLIYVRCQDLPNTYGSIGTNYLMQNIVRSLQLYGDWEDETRRELENLSGPVLAAALRQPEPEFAIVIDGIDENHTYGVARGIIQLTNELAELTCPIVLTTRKEHFEAMFGNYESALEQIRRDALTRKGGTRHATVVELKVWSDIQVAELLGKAINAVSAEQRKNLQEFMEKFHAGEVYRSFLELPRHPLFLHMMLELAADGVFDLKYRVEVIEEWVKRKIRRDLSVPRSTAGEVNDINAYIDRMMDLMGHVALEMTAGDETDQYLLEVIDSGIIQRMAMDILGYMNIDISMIVTRSVLVPAARRESDIIPVKFYHRLLHEFFLARHVHHNRFDIARFPKDVIRICSEFDLVGVQ
jgi:hypothetical protein